MTRGRELLVDEIALREASLDDAARELESGDLSLEQFAVIEARENAAIENVRRALSALALETPTAPRSRVRRARWLALALVCFAVVLGVVLYAAIAPRQAGSSATGSLSLGRTQQIQQLLTEAEADVANVDVVAALSAYHQVLTLDATNVVALTQSGWLDFSAGSAARRAPVVALGITELEKAITLAPRNPASRLYFAIVAASTPGNRAEAKREFEIFLALKPPAGQLAIAQPFLATLGLKTTG